MVAGDREVGDGVRQLIEDAEGRARHIASMRDPRVLSHLLQIVDKEEQRLGRRLERGTLGCHRAGRVR